MATKKQPKMIHKVAGGIVKDNDEIVAILDKESVDGWKVVSLDKREISLTKVFVTIFFMKEA